jgi:hypothetical protein
VGFNTTLNKSESRFLSHTASILATLAAMYYASTVLWAMESYFLLDQEIIVEQYIRKYSSGPLYCPSNLNMYNHEALHLY